MYDGRTDGGADIPSFKDARTHLKRMRRRTGRTVDASKKRVRENKQLLEIKVRDVRLRLRLCERNEEGGEVEANMLTFGGGLLFLSPSSARLKVTCSIASRLAVFPFLRCSKLLPPFQPPCWGHRFPTFFLLFLGVNKNYSVFCEIGARGFFVV